jgi:hypothetical protein
MKIFAFITDQEAVKNILGHRDPNIAESRAPPPASFD